MSEISYYKGKMKTEMTIEALQSEMAQYLQMDNLSFLLGAGCSSNIVDENETGIPGMAVLYKSFFEKNHSGTYTAKPFREHMKNQGYKEIAICGLDECGCVGATAKGAVKTGANVVMIENCIGRRFPDAKVRKMRDELKALGVKYAKH